MAKTKGKRKKPRRNLGLSIKDVADVLKDEGQTLGMKVEGRSQPAKKRPGKPGRPAKKRVNVGYRPHAGQAKFHASKARFRVLIAGVRWGKTIAGAFDLVSQALDKPGHYWAVSPTYRMLQVAEAELAKIIDSLPDGTVVKHSIPKHSWVLKTGRHTTTIECRSTEWPDTLRGPGLDGCWVDEASYVKEEAARILRTRVSDKLGRIWLTTTPRGKNWVYRWYLRGNDERWPDYASWRFPTNTNPHFPPSEWDEAQKDLPREFFLQEYQAEFLDQAAGVFRDVDLAVRADGAEMRVQAPLFLGIDWAKAQDFTVMTVMAASGDVLDFVRMQKIPWGEQRAQAIRLANKWKATIIHDSTGLGDPIHDALIEDLGGDERVVGMKFSTESRQRMVRALQNAFEDKQITLPNERALLDELRWFEYEMLPSGVIRYKAPKHSHSDCVWSLALANWGRCQQAAEVEAVIIEVEPDRIERASADGLGYHLGGVQAPTAGARIDFGHGRKRFLGGH